MKKILSLFVFFLFISNGLIAQENNQEAPKPACKAKTEAVKECNHSAEQKAACKGHDNTNAEKPACKGMEGQAMNHEEAKPACKTGDKATCKGHEGENATSCKSKEMNKKEMRKSKKSKKSC